MTFMEAAAKAKDGNRAFYRKAWRQVRRERTTRVGLMFGWYERSWVADRRNPSIKTKTATGFKFGEMLTAFDSTCFTYNILNLGYEDLMAADYEIEPVQMPTVK